MMIPLPLISVIIPAYNDAVRLERVLVRLSAIRDREYPNMEVIVAVRPSADGTEAVAARYGARMVLGGKPSEGRNAGVDAAHGDMFLFLDADAVPNFGTLSVIAKKGREKNILGTCTAYPNHATFLAMGTVAAHNFMRWSGIAKGMTNLLFVHSKIVRDRGIRYDPKRNIGEHADFIHRAIRNARAKFHYIRIQRGYEFAVDRYERVGYLRTFWFWARWWIGVYILKRSAEKLESEYWTE